MTDQDIRWTQRFSHFSKAFSRLKEGVDLAGERRLSNLEEQGLIQAFEFTHELAWSTLKDFLESRGVQGLYGSRDTTREAFKNGLIEDGDAWMEMIQSRNLTSHTYNQDIAASIADAVCRVYFDQFRLLLDRFARLQSQETA
ncbi:MAG: nucleotidyltransferase substrate binding protein [Thermodesulfobacteriota bacterium]|nr:nucleotidyltransferase substrate binding protein [Thermodesulfobacteriota bacterium]